MKKHRKNTHWLKDFHAFLREEGMISQQEELTLSNSRTGRKVSLNNFQYVPLIKKSDVGRLLIREGLSVDKVEAKIPEKMALLGYFGEGGKTMRKTGFDIRLDACRKILLISDRDDFSKRAGRESTDIQDILDKTGCSAIEIKLGRLFLGRTLMPSKIAINVIGTRYISPQEQGALIMYMGEDICSFIVTLPTGRNIVPSSIPNYTPQNPETTLDYVKNLVRGFAHERGEYWARVSLS
jgi:hypothetical protein